MKYHSSFLSKIAEALFYGVPYEQSSTKPTHSAQNPIVSDFIYCARSLMAFVLHFEVLAWIATSLLKTIKGAKDVY